MVVTWATASGAQSLPAGAAPAPSAATVEDPIKRETPRGSFLGFVTAAQGGNYTLAAEFLQWPAGVRLGLSKAVAAQQLMFVLNHGFEGNLDRMSNSPEGSLADGLSSDREHAGTALLANRERVDILLNRVRQEGGPAIWLVAGDVVAEIPRLYKESGLPEVERVLPAVLTRTHFGGLPLWIPIALASLLPIIYVLVRVVMWSGASLVRRCCRRWKRSVPSWPWDAWSALLKPTAFLLTVLIHLSLADRIGIPVYHRHQYNRTVTVSLLAGLVWWLWRLQDLAATRMNSYLEVNQAGRAQAVSVIGKRVLKGATLGVAVLVALAAFGVDLTATLAGLGIGGLALAFAAQKTLENVFGGISVLADKSIVVGDVCQIGKYMGTIEDVGLRAMRMRTLARTVVHVPNGTLSTVEVENFSRRDKFLLQTTIGLRYETTPGQLTCVLQALRDVLASDARVEPDTRRVRFVEFGPYSLDVEIFAYLLVPDYGSLLAVREELLLRIMQAVPDAGTGFAFPSQTLYVNRAAGSRPTPW
jgi:MscS family membrane protein